MKIDNYFQSVQACIEKLNHQEIECFLEILANARKNGRQIFVMGNGGSASTASHFCCDINKGLVFEDGKNFKLICLSDSITSMLAYANDFCYDVIFEGQLKNFMQPQDVVIGFSGSGNSKNVLNAIKYANNNGAITVGITGYDGGELRRLAKYSVNTNTNDMQISEDVHFMLCHFVFKYFQTKLQPKESCGAKNV